VESTYGSFTVVVPATDDPAQVGPVHLVIFAVKGHSAEAAAHMMAPLVGPDTTILPLSNGVDIPDMLSALYGPQKVLAGTAHIESVIGAPGVITHTSRVHRITIGELDGPPTPRVQAIADLFRSSGVEAIVAEHGRVAMWNKFVFICGMSGVSALARASIGEILGHPPLRTMFISTMHEVVAVGQASGIPLETTLVDQLLSFAEGLDPHMTSSMYKDMEQGRRLEIETLNGAVVRRGDALGVDTPMNDAIYAVLSFMNRQA